MPHTPMSVTATFFLPAIHERPTGGNLYNRRVIDGLRGRISVDVRVHTRDRLTAPDRALPGPHVAVVDSLLLHELDDCRSWMARLDADHLVLLVHYLDLLDPVHAERHRLQRERRCLSLFDRSIATSRFVKRQLSGEFVSSDRVVVIRPGTGRSFRRPGDRTDHDVPRILTVASLLPGKGLVEAVDVLESVDEECWRWTVVGDDSLDRAYADRLRQRIAETPVRERIELAGPVDADEIVAQYDAADLFFLPSEFETCSMVTMEAMSRGLPVVAYDVGGLGELVEEGKTGFLAALGDTQAVSDRISLLLADHGERRRLGKAAREASRAFETWDETADRFVRMLRGL